MQQKSLPKLLKLSVIAAALIGWMAGAPHAVSAQTGQQTPQGYTAVATGTRVLIGLDDELDTTRAKANDKFAARTLVPFAAEDGSIIPPGSEVSGHISKVEAAGTANRARLWLTLDTLKAPGGDAPLVAEIVGVPGDTTIKLEQNREGAIAASTNTGRQDAEAAALGAAAGALAGSKVSGAKGAAMGAAAGAAASFLASIGIGQELDLPKGTKVEIELIRPLYLPAH